MQNGGLAAGRRLEGASVCTGPPGVQLRFTAWMAPERSVGGLDLRRVMKPAEKGRELVFLFGLQS